LEEWLWRLQAVWNWAVRKIELDGRDGVRYSSMEFRNQLAGHSKKIEIPSHTIQGVLRTAHDAWVRCYKGIGGSSGAILESGEFEEEGVFVPA